MNSMSETFDLAYGDPRSRLVEELRRRVGGLEAATPQDEITFSTGTPPLDQLLDPSPLGRGQGEGPLRYGMLVEWLSGLAHNGAATLSLLCAREACRPGGALVAIDRLQTFYPPAAAAWGVDLGRLIIVRPRGPRDALWATLQSLRSPAVAAVWAPLERLDSREFRQLQLAAQAGRTLGLLLRPAHARGQPSWADVRLFLEGGRRKAEGGGTRIVFQSAFHLPPSALRLIEVRILRQRGARPGRSIFLEIDDATHTIKASSQPSLPQSLAPGSTELAEVSPQPHASLPLFMASELADPVPRSHPARA
jgi:hypothetical protein